MTLTNEAYEQLRQQLQESEKHRQKAENLAQKIRQELEEKFRDLSWHEALALCNVVYANPKIEPRYKIVRASQFTNAKDRCHPIYLRHWATFQPLHESAFKKVSRQLAQPEAKAFQSRNFYQKAAKIFMSRCVLRDEATIVEYEQQTVENMVFDAWRQI